MVCDTLCKSFFAAIENHALLCALTMDQNAQGSLGGELAAAREGDASGLWRASEAMRPYLRAVAGGVLRGRIAGKVDVSDVVQQSLLASIERFGQFRGDTRGEWQKWLVVIVRNEARNLLRYWHQDRREVAKEAATAGSQVLLGQGDEDAQGPRLPGDSPSPSRQVARREDASRILQVLDRLPHEYREVLKLRHLEGLSHQEISTRLGKSPAAVRQTWVRALRRMRELWE